MSAVAASQYPVPANGLSMADFGRRRTAAVAAQNTGAQASLSAGGSLGDVGQAQASAAVTVDTRAPVAGFVVGILILVGIRVAWELAEELD